MKSDSMLKAVALLILCAFFWGSCFPIGKHALNEVHPLTLILWRFILATLCLAIYLQFTRSSKPHLTVMQWGWVVIVSAIGIGGLNLGLFTGLTLTNATNGSLIMALSPLTTSLITSIALRRLPALAQIVSLLVSLTGVLLVITNGNLASLAHMQLNRGDQMIFCGMLAWSLYTYFSQGISRWLAVIPYTLIGMICGALAIGTMIMFTPEVNPLTELTHASTVVISEVFYVAILGTVAGYLLWINGVRSLGSATASLFFNFVPIFAVLTAFLMGQPVTQLQLLGIAVVIVGLLLPRLKLPQRTAQSCNS
ncbi:DMT family transporter [Shewanella dokdonensis]|uniref:DMT family transporter n=1 Tax=Shewanella dokdonensis TaxID=712036 RepID=A0ABX8DIJ8_9GAMM|nr:DMT family transporter [Shewanella dokdonensis]MCL1075589.1 DMT family transporter [Shewanella dokdonensis]QVK24598.1 DMT family transporter [Shewanella dokdonensis]